MKETAVKNQAKSVSLGTNLLILVLLTILDSILARFAVLTNPVAPGVAEIYFSVAFMIASTLWFGAWGAIATYLSCFIGAGILSGISVDVSFYWSFADLWQVLIPLIAFRKLNADINLRTKRDFLIFLLFGWVLNNLVGASWGSTTLAIGQIISWNEVPSTLLDWFTSNLIVTIIITPLFLRFVTPYIQRANIGKRHKLRSRS
jgi:hypothetical protein